MGLGEDGAGGTEGAREKEISSLSGAARTDRLSVRLADEGTSLVSDRGWHLVTGGEWDREGALEPMRTGSPVALIGAFTGKVGSTVSAGSDVGEAGDTGRERNGSLGQR